MSGGEIDAPARAQAQPGQDSRYAAAAENSTSAPDGHPHQRLARLWAAILAIAAGVAP